MKMDTEHEGGEVMRWISYNYMGMVTRTSKALYKVLLREIAVLPNEAQQHYKHRIKQVSFTGLTVLLMHAWIWEPGTWFASLWSVLFRRNFILPIYVSWNKQLCFMPTICTVYSFCSFNFYGWSQNLWDLYPSIKRSIWYQYMDKMLCCRSLWVILRRQTVKGFNRSWRELLGMCNGW